MSPATSSKRPTTTNKATMEKSERGEKNARDGVRASNRPSTTGVPASAYNPVSGTFHPVPESVTAEVTSNGLGPNGRYRSFDADEDVVHGAALVLDNDTVSTNGSCSEESAEDQNNGGRAAAGPGGGGDKRDKVRAKNEKKHQRQKERRAQEMKEKCLALLSERKLEALAKQLVAMGFSKERATAALLEQEGHVERAVSWLLESGSEEASENARPGGVKIDISEELARLAELEIRYGYSRAEIERAVVSCDGNLKRAAVWLQERHPDSGNSSLEDGVGIGQSLQQPGLGTVRKPGPQPALNVQGAAAQLQRPGIAASLTESRREERTSGIAAAASPMAPLQWPRQQPIPVTSSVVGAPSLMPSTMGPRRTAPAAVVPGSWKEMEVAKPAAVAAIRGPAPIPAQPRQPRPLGSPARYAPPGIVPAPRTSHTNQLVGALPSASTQQGVVPSHLAPSVHGFPQPQQQVPLAHLQQQPQHQLMPATPPLPRPTSGGGGGSSTPSSYGGSPSLSPSSWNNGVPSSFSPSSVLFNHPAEASWPQNGTAPGQQQPAVRPLGKSNLSGEPMVSISHQHQPALGGDTSSSSLSSMGGLLGHQEIMIGLEGSTSSPAFVTGTSNWGTGAATPSLSADWSVRTAGAGSSVDWRFSSGLPGSSIWANAVGNLSNGFTSALSLSKDGQGMAGEAVGEGRTYDIWSSSFGLHSGFAEQKKSGQEWTSPFGGKDLFVTPRPAALPFSPLPN